MDSEDRDFIKELPKKGNLLEQILAVEQRESAIKLGVSMKQKPSKPLLEKQKTKKARQSQTAKENSSLILSGRMKYQDLEAAQKKADEEENVKKM